MALHNYPNPLAPKLLERSSFQTELLDSFQNYSLQDKWMIAGILGLCGGGLTYFLYTRRSSAARGPNSLSLPCRSTTTPQSRHHHHHQPNRVIGSEEEFSGICDLPPEVRTRIWQTLGYEDVLNLRLTSHFTKADVDTVVGLNGRLASSDDPDKFQFFQRVALQSCKITQLEDPIDHEFLFNPDVLSVLEIREQSPIPLANVEAILRVSYNLKALKLRLALNEDTAGLSRIVLECLPAMKALSILHVKTRSRYSSATKRYGDDAMYFTSPKMIKSIHLEMPDLAEGELSKWKCVLDKQTSLQSFISQLGNLSWRYYERLLRQNSPSLEKLVLEGLRGWDSGNSTEDPFDWSVLSAGANLKSVDLACSRGGDHDLLASINFDSLPCRGIEEFFVSRISLPPEAVDKVYTEMVNLQRGALDHIGNAGIERANENAWLIHQADEGQHAGWWDNERWWDVIVHGMLGMSIAAILAFAARSAATQELPFGGGSSKAGVDRGLEMEFTDEGDA